MHTRLPPPEHNISDATIAAIARIHAYTDLLLHDMRPDLADTMIEGHAGPSMWRTQPRWGSGSLKYVQNETGFADPTKVRYLHDGRARSLLEAVLWHGGEGNSESAAVRSTEQGRACSGDYVPRLAVMVAAVDED